MDTVFSKLLTVSGLAHRRDNGREPTEVDV
jgi:hypothetical protein